MAAIQGTRISSSVTGMVVVAVGAALLVGGTCGYMVRALTWHVSAPAAAHENRPAQTVDQLPTWVREHVTPAETPDFKVDEFIRSLGYARTVKEADLPAWVREHMNPAETQDFKVDEFIRSLGYAPTVKEADLPAWVREHMTPAQTPEFKVDEFIRSLS
jgi:hypothetical protein